MDLALASVPPSCPQIKKGKIIKKKKKRHWHCEAFFYDRFYCLGFSALTGHKSLLRTATACQWADQCPWPGCTLGLLVEGCWFWGVSALLTVGELLEGGCPLGTTSAGKRVQGAQTRRPVVLTSLVVALLGLSTCLRFTSSRSFPAR